MSVRAFIIGSIEELKSKKSVDYSKGMRKRRCGLCKYFISPDACKKVKGKIQEDMWCKLFEHK